MSGDSSRLQLRGLPGGTGTFLSLRVGVKIVLVTWAGLGFEPHVLCGPQERAEPRMLLGTGEMLLWGLAVSRGLPA